MFDLKKETLCNHLSKITMTFVLLLVPLSLFPQAQSSYAGDVVMPTPEAASLGKFIESDVDLFTGLPSIGVSIYTLQQGPLSLPIGLRYHAGGLRVGETASWAGTNWNLSAGGMVSRTVQGIPDEKINGYFDLASQIVLSGYTTDWQQVAAGTEDTEPDMFNFSAGGYSGKFYWTPDGWQIMDNQELIIKHTVFNQEITQFIIILPNGHRYIYGKYGVKNAREKQLTKSPGQTTNINYNITGWKLLRIETADELQGIDFEYEEEHFMYRQGISCYQEWLYVLSGSGCTSGSAGEDCTNDDGYMENHVQGYRLEKINTTNVSVDFNAVTLRQDLEAEDMMGLQAYSLDEIVITTNGSNYCMQYNLNYDYFNDPTESAAHGKRLRLLSVQQKACDNSEIIPPYIFEYYNSNSTFAPHTLSKQIDHWGYYNGASNNDNLLVNAPPSMIDGFSYGQANRATHTTHVLTGSLYRMTDPKGGHITFDMEANCYHKENGNTEYAFNLQNCVGLEDPAVCCAGGTAGNSETLNYTFTAEELETPIFSVTLQYPLGEIEDDSNPGNNYTPCTDVCEDGNGLITIEMDLTIKDPSNNVVGTDMWTYSFFSSDPLPHTYMLTHQDFATIANLSPGINYSFEINVTCGRGAFMMGYLTDEIVLAGGLRTKTITYHDPLTGNNLVRNYKYTQFGDETKSSGKLFIEPRYAFKFGTANIIQRRIQATALVPLSDPNGYHLGYENVTVKYPNNGKSHHSYTFDTAPTSYSNVDQYPIPPIDPNPENGQEKVHRIFDEAGIAKRVKHTTGNQSFPSPGNNSGFKVTSTVDCEGEIWIYTLPYHISPSVYRINSRRDSLDGVETITDYTYVGNGPLLASESMTNSDGKVHRTDYKYPIDYTFDVEVKDSLIAKNMLLPSFQTEQYVDNVLVDGHRTKCRFFDATGNTSATGSNRLYPHEMERYENTEISNWTTGSWEPQSICNEYHSSTGFIKRKTQDGWKSMHFDYNSSGGLQNFSYENHTRQVNYLPISILPSSSVGVDGQIRNFTYDQLMRLTQMSDRGGHRLTNQNYVFNAGSPGLNYTAQSLQLTPTTGSSFTESETRNYVDGLGRNIQTVQKAYSPNNLDLISAVEYDGEFRVSKSYEVFSSANGTGAYVAAIPASTPFTLTTYEASPLNRVSSVTPPDWHPTTITYGRNLVSVTDPEGTVYPSMSLHIVSELDGNNNKTLTCKDKRGRTVLVIRSTGSNTQSVETFYCYDLKDRLRVVYPSGSSPSTTDLLTSFEYDGNDNILKRDLPDKDPIEYVYDDRNLAVGMSNGQLRGLSKWYVSQYDDYGRVSKGGLYNGITIPTPNNPTISDVQEEYFYDGFNGSTTLGAAIYTDKIRKERIKLLDDLSANSTWIENQYSYDTHGRNNLIESLNHTGDNTTTNLTHDFANNVITSNLAHSAFGNATQIDHRYAYDHRGRNTESFLALNNGTEERIANRGYNHKDELVNMGYGGSGTSTLYTYGMSYNPQGWLTQIGSPIGNNSPTDLFCDNSNSQTAGTMAASVPSGLFYMKFHYDTKVTNMPHPVQYNGNIAAIEWEVPFRRRRGYSYEYDFLDRLTKATWGEDNNGNWENSDFYSTEYTYDDRGNTLTLKRKQQSTYMVGDCYFPEIMDDMSFTYYSGNNQIKNITDSAPCPKEKILPTLIDRDKTFFGENIIVNHTDIDHRAKVNVYAKNDVNISGSLEVLEIAIGTRQQQTIAKGCDTGLPTSNTDGFAQTNTGDYIFDNGGNLIVDPNRNVTIYYNHLNQPYKYVMNGTIPEELHIQYSADGSKLYQQTYRDGALVSRRDYIDGVEYHDQTLESIHHETGRAVLEGASFVYEYYMKDNVGNIRMVFADTNNDGAITLGLNGDFEIRAIDHYYPKGLKQKGTWEVSMNTTPNRYGFSSNELLDDMDLGLMDFHARVYDPVTTFFHQVDPMGEHRSWVSPYNFVQNNPITRVDPSGALDGIGVNSKGAIVYDDGKNDGNIYDLGEYSGALIKSKEEAKNLGISVKTLAEGGEWISSQEDFDTFIKGQLSYINEGSGLELNLDSFTAYYERAEGQRRNAKASTITFNSVSENPDGTVNLKRDSKQLYINPIQAKKNAVFYNIHDLRFTLANELYHLTLPNPQIFETKMALSNYGRRNIEEINSSRFQLNHWTKYNASSTAVNSARRNLELQISIGKIR